MPWANSSIARPKRSKRRGSLCSRGRNRPGRVVARIDSSAVRNTPEVNILIRPAAWPRATAALGSAGFCYREVEGRHVFLDYPAAKTRDAVFLFFANERYRPHDLEPTADVSESEASDDGRYRHLSLQALVRMKLTSYRLKDQVHLQDMIGVGLIDGSWPAKSRPGTA